MRVPLCFEDMIESRSKLIRTFLGAMTTAVPIAIPITIPIAITIAITIVITIVILMVPRTMEVPTSHSQDALEPRPVFHPCFPLTVPFLFTPSSCVSWLVHGPDTHLALGLPLVFPCNWVVSAARQSYLDGMDYWNSNHSLLVSTVQAERGLATSINPTVGLMARRTA